MMSSTNGLYVQVSDSGSNDPLVWVKTTSLAKYFLCFYLLKSVVLSRISLSQEQSILIYFDSLLSKYFILSSEPTDVLLSN